MVRRSPKVGEIALTFGFETRVARWVVGWLVGACPDQMIWWSLSMKLAEFKRRKASQRC